MSLYWQHVNPLECPKDRSLMIWLGSTFWICDICTHAKIYVQQVDEK